MAASTTEGRITFYDIPSKYHNDGKYSCFSFNPWKVRSILNYKGIPYTTAFVEYPDLEPTLRGLGLPPNEEGTAFMPYSSPAIQLPDGTVIMNSATIAPKLEELYPELSLRLDTGLHLEAEKVVQDLAAITWWDGLVTTKDNLLPQRSADYFARTRKEVFGASLEDLAAAKGGETAWRAAEAPGGPLEKLREFLTVHKKEGEEGGPFVLGEEVSYADLVVGSLFECYRRCHRESFERMMGFDARFGELFTACEGWFGRDD